jgi:tetratricopeptide (TPR) repeat protein
VTAASPGYRADLAAVRQRLFEHGAGPHPAGPAAATEVLTLRHREVMLAGGLPGQLIALGDDVERAVGRFPGWPDLRLLRATVALAVHRPDVAAAALHGMPGLTSLPSARVLSADVASFTGDYAAARAGYLRAAREDPQWDTTARLAALALATGAFDEADARYAEAEDEITVKQMRGFAWVRVQRGDLARALGDLDRAAGCYADAAHAYPDWWYVTAHRAALDAVAGRHEEAIAGYRRVLADVDRPEYREALGTALAAMGHTAEAADCHAAALAAYLGSAARGEVHYLHHLAAYYADVQPCPDAAVGWARQDVAVRRNGTTLSLLALCLHRAGRSAEAGAAVDEAFALGAADPVLQARAREIVAAHRA